MSEQSYLAIDPGANGGWVYKSGATLISGSNDGIEKLKIERNTIVYIEKVPPYVGKFIPSSAAFKLGFSYGYLVGVYRQYALYHVTPQVWQKYLEIGTKGKQSTTQWKNLLKSEAIKLFPNRKITLATADAFLILHYALNNHEKRNSPN